MTIYDAIVLGIVQGLTEFLPVSSSGHLVLFQKLLGYEEPMISFDIAVHWGTLLAVFVFFGKDIWGMISQTFAFLLHLPKRSPKDLFMEYPYTLVAMFVIIATIPTAIIGLVFEEAFEYFFGSLLAVGIAWFIMGLILVLSRKFQGGGRNLSQMNQQDSFLIGLVQGLAIIPGISRSGSTILCAMLLGIEKREAARFSFLLSIPAILGAGVFKLREGIEFMGHSTWSLAIAFLTASLVGYISISFLLEFINRGKLYIFGYYCLAISAFAIFLSVSTGSGL